MCQYLQRCKSCPYKRKRGTTTPQRILTDGTLQVGIYMLLDVNSPLGGESINRAAPWESYYAGYLNRTFAVVEAFKDYPNTAAFFSANEVINDIDTGEYNPPYIRAVTRDLKQYVKNHASRPIPVGYSAADVRDNLLDSWNYLRE
jgi:hypothetical protein